MPSYRGISLIHPFVLEASGRETCSQLFSVLNAAFLRVHGDEVMYYYVIF